MTPEEARSVREDAESESIENLEAAEAILDRESGLKWCPSCLRMAPPMHGPVHPSPESGPGGPQATDPPGDGPWGPPEEMARKVAVAALLDRILEHANEGTVSDLLRLARAAQKDVHTAILAEIVAYEIAINGRAAAEGFLRGYWYATGTSRYNASRSVAEVLGLTPGDLRTGR